MMGLMFKCYIPCQKVIGTLLSEKNFLQGILPYIGVEVGEPGAPTELTFLKHMDGRYVMCL